MLAPNKLTTAPQTNPLLTLTNKNMTTKKNENKTEIIEKLFPELKNLTADELEKFLRDNDPIKYEARFERGKLINKIKQLEEDVKNLDTSKTMWTIKKDKLETQIKIYKFEIKLIEAEKILETKI